MRQFHNVQQCNVPFAALDSTHIITMQLRKLGQAFLRQSALHAEFAHSLAEDCSRIGTSHLWSCWIVDHYESTHDKCDNALVYKGIKRTRGVVI